MLLKSRGLTYAPDQLELDAEMTVGARLTLLVKWATRGCDRKMLSANTSSMGGGPGVTPGQSGGRDMTSSQSLKARGAVALLGRGGRKNCSNSRSVALVGSNPLGGRLTFTPVCRNPRSCGDSFSWKGLVWKV